MANALTDAQKIQLKRIWLECRGQERLAENFTTELTYFMDNCPELIADGNKKIETAESCDYAAVAKQCDKLLQALAKIPELDRLNLLPPREERPEYNGRALPIYDPLEFMLTVQENATRQSRELKGFAKHERQLGDLRDFIERFPPLQNISRDKFIELAGELWPDINLESFRKAYRPRKK